MTFSRELANYLVLIVILFICGSFAVEWGEFASFPELQLPMLSGGGIEGGYNFNYQVPTLFTPVQQPNVANYPPVNYQPPILTSSWQENQKSGSAGFQGPITTIGSRNNVPSVGANVSPYGYATPNYAYDQRGYGYPNTAHQHSYTSNNGFDQKNYGYSNPSYEPSYGYGSTNYGYPSRSNLNSNSMPNAHTANQNHAYDQGNHAYQGSNQMRPSTIPNHAYVPSAQVYPGEHHVQSSQVYDQRNYGYSSATVHDTNSQTHPIPTDIY